MQLYYFTSERYGLEAIRDSRIKIARINELNDPFEFLGLKLDRVGRRIMRDTKDAMSESTGMISMSTHWHHPLLWGHYADKHKGICLGFEVPETDIFKIVVYHKNRLTMPEIGISTLYDMNEEAMQHLLYKKFDAWAYESEYRAFCKLEDPDPVSDLYFLPFSENLALTQVILGERSKVTRARLDKVLGSSAGKVEKFKSRAGFTKFEVVKNRRRAAWK
jgi:hypothetical protein